MPIVLDPSLPPSLYPLAWLVGSWNGTGAAQVPGPDGTLEGRRVDQHLVCSPDDDGTLTWVMTTDLVDAPAPLPPTSVFYGAQQDSSAEQTGGARELLVREKGRWRVGDPLPGQDLEAAQKAAPGSPEAVISYAVELELDGSGHAGSQLWTGEVRGPRIQIALATREAATRHPGARYPGLVGSRMFGLVGGRLMWLWERPTQTTGEDNADGADEDTGLTSFLSVELDRG
jgi:hypothetical protein